MLLPLIAATLGAMSEPPIERLAWMSGSWACEIWGGTFEERWAPPAAGTMQGNGRLIVSGQTRFMEFMAIEESKDGLVMWMVLGRPSAGPTKPVPFKLVAHGESAATFERSDEDYPKRIVYRAGPDGTLLCTLEGEKDGKPARDVFEFKPIPR
jgi:hypothetical protein